MAHRIVSQPAVRFLRNLLLVAGLPACGQGEYSEPLSSKQAELVNLSWYGYTKFFSLSGLGCHFKTVPIPGKTPFSTFFLCVIDLRKAYIKTAHGPYYVSGGKEDKNKYWRKSVSDLWVDGYNPPVIVNASFFGTAYNPTNLSFPYKRDGGLLTYGTDCSNPLHMGNVRIFQVWSDRQYAAINAYDCSVAAQAKLTEYGSAPEILGTLTNDVDKDRSIWKGRTFLALNDSDNNGTRETVLIFSSAKATQDVAYQELSNLTSNEIVMFDGGGSTQMVINGELYIPSSDGRNIPNALAVYAW